MAGLGFLLWRDYGLCPFPLGLIPGIRVSTVGIILQRLLGATVGALLGSCGLRLGASVVQRPAVTPKNCPTSP